MSARGGRLSAVPGGAGRRGLIDVAIAVVVGRVVDRALRGRGGDSWSPRPIACRARTAPGRRPDPAPDPVDDPLGVGHARRIRHAGGVGLGTFLAWALVKSSSSSVLGVFSVPPLQLGVFVVIGAARRAARLDIVTAIGSE